MHSPLWPFAGPPAVTPRDIPGSRPKFRAADRGTGLRAEIAAPDVKVDRIPATGEVCGDRVWSRGVELKGAVHGHHSSPENI